MSDGDQQLDDEVLHEICGISATDEGYSAELAADLRRVVTLTQTSQSRHNGQLEHAIALLTSALGRLPKHHLTHLPFGYDGPRVQSCGWVDREGIETAAKQIAGLLWSDASPGMVAVSVANATTESVRLSLINQQEYDAWHPGMASGSGWRRAVKATPYGLTKGRLLCGDGQNSSKPATSPVAVTQPPKQQSSLSIISALCDDANYCLQLLGNLCRAYELMSATGRRMSGGGEEWHFDNPSDGDQYQDAEHRVESVKQQLPEPLARLIDWGRSQSLDLPDSDFPFSLCATSGVKEDIAAEYELAVRRVLTALMTASSRPGTTGGTPQSPIENTRLRAIESLLQPLIRVDVGILNLGVHLQRLRTENPHGFVNALPDGKLTSAQVRDVQERIESWTDPLQKKIEKAKEACDNIASQLSGLVSEPTLWETDLRTSLRLLGEAVSSLPQMMGTEVAESHVIGLGCLLYASGTQLQDARDTIAGAASAPETPSFARPAPGTSTPSGPPSGQLTADNLLQDFQHAIEKHRLTFLYVATPSRLEMHAGIRQLETIDRHMWLDERIPSETIDSEGHFLFKYRGVLERFAQAAIGRFGSGKGMRAREFCDGEFVEVEGGSLPHWSLDETDCSVMESSSELMLDACKMLARADHERRFQKLIQSTRALLHDGGQPRWYASVLVSWDYLSRLDDLIARIKSAEIDQLDHPSLNQSADQESNKPSAGAKTPTADIRADALLTERPKESQPKTVQPEAEVPTLADVDGNHAEDRALNVLTVDPSTLRVTFEGRSLFIPPRSKALFQILARIAGRPGHRVEFDSLREVGDVWDGSCVEDSTIRGSISRLRGLLRKAQMHSLADRIKTGTLSRRQYVMLAIDDLVSDSN